MCGIVDVRNSDYILVSVRIWKNWDSVWNAFRSVQFEKKIWFGSDIIVTYYLLKNLNTNKFKTSHAAQ